MRPYPSLCLSQAVIHLDRFQHVVSNTDLFFLCPVLKVVENLGVSYVRNTDVYKSKLEAELRKLKFPYKVSKDQDMELSCTLFSLHHSRMMTKSRGDEMLFLKLPFCHFVRDVVFL